jgi:beta-glucosidase
LKDKVDAILLPWQPGQEGGNSGRCLGKVNRLKVNNDFPVKYEDTPSAKTGLEHRQKTQQVLPI